MLCIRVLLSACFSMGVWSESKRHIGRECVCACMWVCVCMCACVCMYMSVIGEQEMLVTGMRCCLCLPWRCMYQQVHTSCSPFFVAFKLKPSVRMVFTQHLDVTSNGTSDTHSHHIVTIFLTHLHTNRIFHNLRQCFWVCYVCACVCVFACNNSVQIFV